MTFGERLRALTEEALTEQAAAKRHADDRGVGGWGMVAMHLAAALDEIPPHPDDSDDEDAV